MVAAMVAAKPKTPKRGFLFIYWYVIAPTPGATAKLLRLMVKLGLKPKDVR
jgi:hypothetical protein